MGRARLVYHCLLLVGTVQYCVRRPCTGKLQHAEYYPIISASFLSLSPSSPGLGLSPSPFNTRDTHLLFHLIAFSLLCSVWLPSFLQATLLVSSSPLRDIRLVNNRRALVTNVTQALIPKIPCLIFRTLFSLAPNSQLLILATCLWSQSRFKLADCHSPHQPSPTNPQHQQSCPERRCPQHRPPRPTSMARTAPSSSPRCRWPSSCPSPPSSTEQAAAPTQPPASAPCRPCPQHPPRRPTPYNQARPSRRGDARPLLPPPLRDTAGKVTTVAVAAIVATMPSRCRRRQRDHARSSR